MPEWRCRSLAAGACSAAWLQRKAQQKAYSGVTRECFGMGAVVAKAREAMNYAVAQLKTAFAK